MISEAAEAFVWIWLPDAGQPVVCGRLDDTGTGISFVYARSYLARPDAVAVYGAELPLRADAQFAASGNRLPLCIDDAMPDSWGRQLVNHRLGIPNGEFGELTYLLASGSDRIGALDFQTGPADYVPRGTDHPDVDVLATAAARIQAGLPLDPDLEAALLHGTAIGGARPKALLEALLVERFDRGPNGQRTRMVSALTILSLTPFPEGRYATYVDLADQIRARFTDPDRTLAELFARIAFNILCGNTDDHGRNHAAFVGQDSLVLTPAYDICPQPRTGRTANQAMAFTPDGRRESRIGLLAESAAVFHLTPDTATGMIDAQVDVIRSAWDDVCDDAELPRAQRAAFWGTQFLNSYVFS